MQYFVTTSQTHDSNWCFDVPGSAHAHTKGSIGYFVGLVHLPPKRCLVIVHTHDSIRQLLNKQARDRCLAAEFQLKGLGRSRVQGILWMICVLTLENRRRVVPTYVALIRHFRRSPRRPLRVPPSQRTGIIPEKTASTVQTFVTIQCPKALRCDFIV